MSFFNVEVLWKPKGDMPAPLISAKLEGVAAADKLQASNKALEILSNNVGYMKPYWKVVNVVEMA